MCYQYLQIVGFLAFKIEKINVLQRWEIFHLPNILPSKWQNLRAAKDSYVIETNVETYVAYSRSSGEYSYAKFVKTKYTIRYSPLAGSVIWTAGYWQSGNYFSLFLNVLHILLNKTLTQPRWVLKKTRQGTSSGW